MKPDFAVTVKVMVVVSVSDPEVPVIATVAAPIVAVLLAVNVKTLVPVVGLVPKVAVTPAGSPDAESVTAPVKPQAGSVTVIVSVALPLWTMLSVVSAGVIVKPLAGTATVSAIVVVAVNVPEMPVMVIVAVATLQLAGLYASVSTLVPVVELGLKLAVIPVGNPDATSVTAPVNPPISVIVIASVAVLPGTTVKVAIDSFSVKPGLEVIVSAIVVFAVSAPEVPVMVTVEVPAVAVALAVIVTRLVFVAGLVPKVAVTPLGNPEAARVTAPVKGLTSVTVMVSVALAPWATESVAAEGLSVKLPVVAAPQVMPLTANDVGTALVEPFQVPLKPTPVTLPPAATLPL